MTVAVGHRVEHKGMLGRLANASGFSLVEMLAALLILSLMTGMVAMGVTTATTAYGKEQFASQADVLAGDIENALAETFRFVGEKDGHASVKFKDQSTDVIDPQLVIINGRFKIRAGNSGDGDAVLNEGAYGGCSVSFASGTNVVKPVGPDADGNYITEGTYEIRDASGGSSRTYSFYFKSVRGNEKNPMALSSSINGGSGGSDKTEVDRSALSGLIDSANAIAQGNKTASAFNQLQTDIAAAVAVRDNADASQDEVDAACSTLLEAIKAFNRSAASSGGDDTPDYATPIYDKVAEAEALLRNESRSQDAVNALQAAIASANEIAIRSDLTEQLMNNAIATLSAAMETYRNASDGGSGGGDNNQVFSFTINGVEYSVPIVEDDGTSGTFSANTVYLYEGNYYFAAKDVYSPWNPNLVTLSGWNFADTGIAKVIATTVDASVFTTSDYKCPSKIEKGTLYYDATNGKLWASHQTQDWLVRPDVNSNGWDDVSGLLSGQ